jgi:hypothetical protein
MPLGGGVPEVQRPQAARDPVAAEAAKPAAQERGPANQQAAEGPVCQNGGCFGAGTPFRMPWGAKAVEYLQVGDELLSRADGSSPDGVLQIKRVTDIHNRTACLWELRVDGRVIRVTEEHPFHVKGQGWVPLSLVAVGDELATEGGRWVRVEGLRNTGEWERVYNVTVEDFHTYFVGGLDWGFSVWAHNVVKCWGEAGRDGTKLLEDGFHEVDPTAKTDDIRNRPGVAHGGEDLPALEPGQTWLDKGVGRIPKEVADQLRGRSFTDWRNFRQEFWKAVANVPQLMAQFNDVNQARMHDKRPPIAAKKDQLGGRRISMELDHAEPLDIIGYRGLYDLGNIFVAPPRVNLSFEQF